MDIRRLLPGDVEAIVEIETSSPSPWAATAILKELDRPKGVQLVALCDGKGSRIIGWCSAMLVAGEAELLKIAVRRGQRRLGVASALLQQLMKECTQHGVGRIFLEVRSRNSSARALYLKLGFSEMSLRRNYYQRPNDDALIYQRKLCVEGEGK